MKDFALFYDFLRELLSEFRQETRISVAEFCRCSGVSTRTYSKLVKHIPFKAECYVRLVIGLCRVAAYDEFMRLWEKFGKRIYEEYGE